MNPQRNHPVARIAGIAMTGLLIPLAIAWGAMGIHESQHLALRETIALALSLLSGGIAACLASLDLEDPQGARKVMKLIPLILGGTLVMAGIHGSAPLAIHAVAFAVPLWIAARGIAKPRLEHREESHASGPG